MLKISFKRVFIAMVFLSMTALYCVTPGATASALDDNSVNGDIVSASSSAHGLVTPSITATATKLGGGGTTVLRWTKVPGAQGYYLYRSSTEVGGYKRLKTVTHGSTTRFAYSGVRDGTIYYYKVIAYHKVGGKSVRSKASAPVKVVQKSLGRASITATATKLGGGGTTVLRWTKVPGAQGYHLYRSSAEVGGYKRLKTIKHGSTTRYAYSGIRDGTVYYYKVIAYHIVSGKVVSSKASAPVKVTQKRLGRAQFTRTDVKLGAIRMSWKKVPGAQGYYLYRSTSKVGGYKRIVTTRKTTYLNSDLRDNKLYYYKVIAYHKVGKSPVRSKASAPRPAATPIRVKPGARVSISGSNNYVYVRGETANYNICVATRYCNTDSHFFYGGAYVYIPSGSYLNVSVEPYEPTVSIINDIDIYARNATHFSEGEYIVGFDIQPGKYVLQGMDDYSYTVCSQPILNSEITNDGRITSDFVDFGDPTTITLQDGDFINVMGFGKRVTGVKIN